MFSLVGAGAMAITGYSNFGATCVQTTGVAGVNFAVGSGALVAIGGSISTASISNSQAGTGNFYTGRYGTTTTTITTV